MCYRYISVNQQRLIFKCLTQTEFLRVYSASLAVRRVLENRSSCMDKSPMRLRACPSKNTFLVQNKATGTGSGTAVHQHTGSMSGICWIPSSHSWKFCVERRINGPCYISVTEAHWLQLPLQLATASLPAPGCQLSEQMPFCHCISDRNFSAGLFFFI